MSQGNPATQWLKGRSRWWWIGAASSGVIVLGVLAMFAEDYTFRGGGWMILPMLGGGWLGERIAEEPMIRSYLAYTFIMWALALASSFLLGYNDVPLGALWAQLATAAMGYWVWKWVIANALQQPLEERESAQPSLL